MRSLSGWFARAGVLRNDNTKGPWGGRGGSEGGSGGGDGPSGPRNPWNLPPDGRRARPTTASSLEDFLRRARGNGGGGGSSGGGSGLPTSPRNLWMIGLGVLVLLWLITCFHIVGPQERGVATSFGRYTGTLDPGFKITLPTPFAKVEMVDVKEVRTENFPSGNQPNLMLTGDQNIVDLGYSVRWDIKNPEDYVFEIAQPTETVRAVAESAMRAAIANVELDQAIGAGRIAIEADVQQRMQALLDEYQSGVRILGVAIKQAAAPAAVDDAFKAVTAAQQQAQSNLNDARAYAQQVIERAQGDAAQFDRIYEQYRMAPEVTRRRLYYETMEQVLRGADKTIVEPSVQTYLPLSELRRRAKPAPAEPTTPAPTAPATETAR
ncbi:protease modulator HflK [Sphingomonas sp. 3-13AW]|jgi:membrane protease subunit HflK|uniref:protease modulator HflK n=1 Tax=Sphingomonas sp. 3-13AW TaxID=3050450 RepID=UPI003BB4E51C